MKIFVFFVALLFFFSCASVDKYNQQISKPHSVQELQEDVDFTYNLLQKYHPELYWFISKDSLDYKFSSLKSGITKPMSGTDFYMKLAPVIASIKQGHSSIYPPQLKQSKHEKKLKGERSSPFKSVRFEEIQNHIYIDKVFSKDSTLLVGSEVLKIDSEETEHLLDSYQNLFTSDGYNNTFYANFKGMAFGYFYERTHPRKDSFLLSLKYRDSLYTHYLKASYDKLKKEKKEKDTIGTPTKKLTKSEKKIAKKEKKAKEKWERTFGYDKYTKEKTREFKFIPLDSTNSVAYIKIKRFKNGDYKSFFEESFTKIDSARCSNLILDLRDNLGGGVNHIDELYSYLTDKDYTLLEESLMNKRMSYLYPFLHSKSPIIKSLAILFYPIHIPYMQIFKVKTRDKKHYFKLRYSKPRSPKENNYKGNLYVLINGTSFSASTTLSTHLKATKRAVFVGEETGGAYNGTVAGLFTNTELPNSKIRLRFGLATINTPYRQKPDGFGVKADVLIPTTEFGKDQQLDWVLKDIAKKEE